MERKRKRDNDRIQYNENRRVRRAELKRFRVLLMEEDEDMNIEENRGIIEEDAEDFGEGGNEVHDESNETQSDSESTGGDSSESSDDSSDISEEHWEELHDQGAPEHLFEKGTYEAQFVPETPNEKMQWLYFKSGMTKSALKETIKVFKGMEPEEIEAISLDPRTVLKTGKTHSVDFEENEDGLQIATYEVESYIRRMIDELKHHKDVPRVLDIVLSCDGVSPFSKSSSCFWTCLLSFGNYFRNVVIPVVLVFGPKKPKNDRWLLKGFRQIRALLRDGLQIGNIKQEFRFHHFVMDSPAKCYIKGIYYYNKLRYPCDKCHIRGFRYKRRTCIKVTRGFKGRKSATYKEHLADNQKDHISAYERTFASFPGLDHIKLFTTDIMHIGYIGIVKLWIELTYPILSDVIKEEINRHIASITAQIGRLVFERLPATFERLDTWKAVDFRTFVLYIGPIALRKLPIQLYEEFIKLHVAFTILESSNSTVEFLDIGLHDCLLPFLNDFLNRVGQEYGCYNTHAAIHLFHDARRLGTPLSDYSCFLFENFNCKFKNMILARKDCLVEFVNKFDEEISMSFLPSNKGKLPNKFLLDGDLWVPLSDPRNDPALVEVECDVFRRKPDPDLYTEPVSSSSLDIFSVELYRDTTRIFKADVARLRTRCITISTTRSIKVFPIRHTL